MALLQKKQLTHYVTESKRGCVKIHYLGLKKWLDNQDVCEILDITKRSLQSYRKKGLLPYSRIEHKIRYKPEDVQKLLQSSAHQSKKM